MEKALKLKLKHTSERPSSIAILNLPGSGTYMSPMRMRSLAQALIHAAAECEAKISGRMLGEPVELEYEIHIANFKPDLSHQSLIVRMVSTFGVGRFSIEELHKILRPNSLPRHLPGELKDIQNEASILVKKCWLIESPGPKGGMGWVLTDEAIMAAKKFTRD